MNVRRLMSVITTTIVGLIAGAGSYTRMHEVAVATHQGSFIGALLPLSVDGLILVATLAIGDGRASTFTAWVAFGVGVTASLAANIYAADPSPAARIVSAWPSVAFLLAVEVLLRRRQRSEPLNLTSTLPSAEPVTAAVVTGRDSATKPPRKRTPDVKSADKWTSKPSSSRTPTAARADRIAAARRQWPDANAVQIAAKVDVSEPTARRHLAKTPPRHDDTSATSSDA